jgi:hypothetical protein
MTTLSKSYIKQKQAIIAKNLLTKSEISMFCRLLNSLKFDKNQEKRDQVWELVNAMEEKAYNTPYDITLEQSQFGIEWLNKMCFTTKGKNRASKMVEDFRERDFDIVRNFFKFEFVGFDESNVGSYNHFAPIYRTIDKDGNYFDYVARMWSAPVIVGRGKCEILTPLQKAM